jgi:hypothetical protein
MKDEKIKEIFLKYISSIEAEDFLNYNYLEVIEMLENLESDLLIENI